MVFALRIKLSLNVVSVMEQQLGIKVKIVLIVIGCMNVLMYQAVFVLPMERMQLKHCAEQSVRVHVVTVL